MPLRLPSAVAIPDGPLDLRHRYTSQRANDDEDPLHHGSQQFTKHCLTVALLEVTHV